MTDSPTPPTPPTPPADNVVPGDVFTRKSLIRNNTVGMFDAVDRITSLYKSFQTGGVPTAEWLPALIALFPDTLRAKLENGASYLQMLIDIVGPMLQGDIAAAIQSPAFLSAIQLEMPDIPGMTPAMVATLKAALAPPRSVFGMSPEEGELHAGRARGGFAAPPLPPHRRQSGAMGFQIPFNATHVIIPGDLTREQAIAKLNDVHPGFSMRFSVTEVERIDDTVVEYTPPTAEKPGEEKRGVATKVGFVHRMELDQPAFPTADEDEAVAELPRTIRLRRMVHRLFADAPKMMLPDGTPDPTQAPALPCIVVLRSVPAPTRGVLSTTPEGCLRLLSGGEVEDPDAPPPAHPRAPRATKKVMVESFFDWEDLITIVIERDIKLAPGSGIVS